MGRRFIRDLKQKAFMLSLKRILAALVEYNAPASYLAYIGGGTSTA
jgi:hypothetical protein